MPALNEVTGDDDQAALADTESYVILLLADSGLPTGGFVASAGLEAWACHGLLTRNPGQSHPLSTFVLENVRTYASLAEPFVGLAWDTCSSDSSGDVTPLVDRLARLDGDLHACTLGHVARRASLAQGAALLTLYVKSFRPASTGNSRAVEVMHQIKARVRLGTSPGHFPTMWGAFCAAIGVSRPRAIELHVFLHARAIVSSAVRLGASNVGPYAAQLLLMGDVRHILAAHNQAKVPPRPAMAVLPPASTTADSEWDWDWPEDNPIGGDRGYLTTTWPLLELVQGRHDVLHTRLFNS